MGVKSVCLYPWNPINITPTMVDDPSFFLDEFPRKSSKSSNVIPSYHISLLSHPVLHLFQNTKEPHIQAAHDCQGQLDTRHDHSKLGPNGTPDHGGVLNVRVFLGLVNIHWALHRVFHRVRFHLIFWLSQTWIWGYWLEGRLNRAEERLNRAEFFSLPHL